MIAAKHRRAVGLALLGSLALAGCGRLGSGGLPSLGGGAASKVENRVWIDDSPDAPRGSLRAFVSDGTLVMTSCTETYRLAPWRWVEGDTLVWEEDGRVLRAEVSIPGPDAMALSVDLGNGETLAQSFHAAKSPVVCGDFR